MRFYASSIHDSDDAIKAVQGLNVVIHEEGPSTCGLREEPEVGNCSSTKPLLTADFPAPLAPTTATRLTCDTVRFTSTIEEYTEVHARHAQDDLAAAPHVLKETKLQEGEFLSSRYSARSARSSELSCTGSRPQSWAFCFRGILKVHARPRAT